MFIKIILAMIILRIILYSMYFFKINREYKNVKSSKFGRFGKINYLIEGFYQVIFLSEITLFAAFVDVVSEKIVTMHEFLLQVTQKASYKTYDLIFDRFEPKENGDEE